MNLNQNAETRENGFVHRKSCSMPKVSCFVIAPVSAAASLVEYNTKYTANHLKQ